MPHQSLVEATRNSGRRGERPLFLGTPRPTTISRDLFCHASGRTHDSRLSPNAIAYLRVSTEEQADSGLGIDAQRASVTAAAARLGLALRDVHVDAGMSGSLSIAQRPILMQAARACRRGDVLLVAKRDRLGRDYVEVGLIERDLKKHGARVVSAAGEGTNNENPDGVLFRGMIDIFAHYEREIGRARTKGALDAKRARGERTGQLPFGFMLAADGKHLEPNPIEQDKLAKLHALKATGKSYRQIADALNAAGVTTRKGTPWRFQYVANALRRTA